MLHDLPWFFIDDHGQEQGPVRGSKLRDWMQSGNISNDIRVRLHNWDGHFTVEQLWPNSEAAFLLPPDIYTYTSSSSTSVQRLDGPEFESTVIALEPIIASSAKVPPEEKKQARPAVGTAKADVEREIALILATSPVLRRADFDPMVRQHLHAFHSLGGASQVRATVERRPRESVKSWPAYLYKLLKNAFATSKAARYPARHKARG
ncbi:unnamed protein product [Durusdinium trenchii]|uniref:GYF domain-containing protein n=1 Tax=Durusdinium trenchii TaxID=1381693 RepID=A0ABP0M482_9DINO